MLFRLVVKLISWGSIIALCSCSQGNPPIILTLTPDTIRTDYQPESIALSGVSPDSLVALREIDSGLIVPLQYDYDSLWRYILPELDTNRIYQFTLVPATHRNYVTCEISGDSISVKVDNLAVLTYQMGVRQPPDGLPAYYQRSGFIHPVYTPDGRVITDDFPDGHPHQHGIFSAWANTRFQGRKVDFWNQQNQSGTIVFDSLMDVREGPVFGGFTTRQHHLALNEGDTVIVLEEIWRIRVYKRTDKFIWDIELAQQNISQSPLELLPYIYGGMAFRGSASWNDTTIADPIETARPHDASFLTSDGKGRLEGNHTRPEWVCMFGEIDQAQASITVWQLPVNAGYPQYVRIHPIMPYFCFFPVLEKGIILTPGDTYTASYRVMVQGNSNLPLSQPVSKKQ